MPSIILEKDPLRHFFLVSDAERGGGKNMVFRRALWYLCTDLRQQAGGEARSAQNIDH